jgi:hypothetical protein
MKVESLVRFDLSQTNTVPEKSGKPEYQQMRLLTVWIPAFAGMTAKEDSKTGHFVDLQIDRPSPKTGKGDLYTT